MRKSSLGISLFVTLLFSLGALLGQGTTAPEPTNTAGVRVGGYLFAHMTKADYGRLYYAASSDGLRWRKLNQGQRILADYRGHPDIVCGHDGKFYLIGNHSTEPQILLWVSSDLVQWRPHASFAPDLTQVPNFHTTIRYIGAPKIYFDATEARYVITWNCASEPSRKDDPERFWLSMRTLYVTSKDLQHFSSPRRLFDYDFATIHTIVRREGAQWVAILKDERVPSFDCPTGKSIRLATAPALEGPWSQPGLPITPNYREAQTVIPRIDGRGWYLYYEQYPGIQYGLSTAPSLTGPWYAKNMSDYSVPSDARHGCMLALTPEQYQTLVAAFPAARN